MATKIACTEHIPRYSPAEVFEAGIYTDTLPTDVEGFVLETEADKFSHGVAVAIGLVVAQRKISLDAEVTEFKPAERVLIEGSSRAAGQAAVWLDLEPHEEDGTSISYGISIKHSLLTQCLEGSVRQRVNTILPIYAAGYRQNVINRLEQRQAPRRLSPRRRAA